MLRRYSSGWVDLVFGWEELASVGATLLDELTSIRVFFVQLAEFSLKYF